jgi:hypothetical protein
VSERVGVECMGMEPHSVTSRVGPLVTRAVPDPDEISAICTDEVLAPPATDFLPILSQAKPRHNHALGPQHAIGRPSGQDSSLAAVEGPSDALSVVHRGG